MTRERIAEGLELLVLQLANDDCHMPPDGWTAGEWKYILGLASGAVWIAHARLLQTGRP